MKIYSYENLSKPITLIIFLISIISFKGNLLKAEYSSEELQIESSTKLCKIKIAEKFGVKEF